MKNKHKEALTVHEAGPCLNCGAQLWPADRYCPKCGQKRLEHDEMSFNHLARESFLDYFHADSKFFGTIFHLLFKPGFLTIEFMRGKRKTYVEPFKLFLVISVVYFLLLSVSHKPEGKESPSPVFPEQNLKNKKDVNDLKFSLKGVPVTRDTRDSMKREIDSTGLKAYVDRHFPEEGPFVKLFLRQALKIMVTTGQSFMTVLEHTASKLIFLLIPVFALLLKLVCRKSKRLYFEHLIFSMHFHAFFFLVMSLMLIVEWFFSISVPVTLLASLVYLFIAMKRNYGFTSGKALGKFLLQVLLYTLIGLPMFFFVLIAIAVMLY